MGLAWSKVEYDESTDHMTVAQPGVLTRPYERPVDFPFRDITIPRPRLGVLGERLSLLTSKGRLVLACTLVLVIAGSFCAISRLWSDRTRTDLESSRMEFRMIEGQLSQLDSLGHNVRSIPESLLEGSS